MAASGLVLGLDPARGQNGHENVKKLKIHLFGSWVARTPWHYAGMFRYSDLESLSVRRKNLLAPSLTQTSQQRGIFGLRSAGFETTGLKLKVELVLAQSRAAVSSEQSCC